MPAKKSTDHARSRKAEQYGDRERLRGAVLVYCRKDWKKRTGREWSDEHTDKLRAELDLDLQPIADAHSGLATAFKNAARIVDDYPADDPRVGPLREFFATLSEKTVSWIGHFSDAISPEVESRLGFVVDATPPEGRTRLVLFDLQAGGKTDAGLLARASLLLGYFPREIELPATVSTVVDLERKSMVQAIKRARKWLKERRFEPVRGRSREDGQPPA